MPATIIIGTGLAGYTLAKEIRKLDKNLPLHLISHDEAAFYSKPLLSNALAKQKTAAELATLSAEKMATQLNATISAHTSVTGIDFKTQQLDTDQGKFTFEQLVLAVGAQPIRPPMKGNATPAVMTVNHLSDYAKFRVALESAEHIAIIGPGLIGCEFANDLVTAHKTVTVIGPDTAPLGRLLPTAAGEVLQKQLQAAGITFHLGTTVQRVDTVNNAHQLNDHGFNRYQLQLANSETLVVDLVLSAIGLAANTDLANTAGITINRGIVVNRHLQTSVANCYALGDCAEVAGHVLPFVLPMMQCARALAQTLTGTPTQVTYPAMPVLVKTPAHAIVVASPAKEAVGQWHITGGDSGIKALFYDTTEHLLGFVITGDKIGERQTLAKQLPAILT